MSSWKATRAVVLMAAGWRCQVHGPNCLGWAVSCDHIVPRSQGGLFYDLRNLRASCGPCQRWAAHRAGAGGGTAKARHPYVSRF